MNTSNNATGDSRGNQPLLPSQEQYYKSLIKQLQEEKRQIYSAALRRVTRIINMADITDEAKKNILDEIWEE